MVSRGYANKEIGEQLSVSLETVRHHLKRVYEKFHVHSRSEAVVKFLGMGQPAVPSRSVAKGKT